MLGISKDVFWALQEEDSDANRLNAHEITTLIKTVTVSGSGATVLPTPKIIFSRCTPNRADPRRQHRGGAIYQCRQPVTLANVKDVVSGINAKLQALVQASKLG